MRDNSVLSNREYDQLLKDLKAKAFKQCDDVVKEFVACSSTRLISVVWACRDQNRRMFNCLQQYMSDEKLQEAEREYLEQRRK